MNEENLQQELKNIIENVDTSHIQNDDQLLRELSTLLGQVVSQCDELQNYLKDITK
jgi:hypothetical protein